LIKKKHKTKKHSTQKKINQKKGKKRKIKVTTATQKIQSLMGKHRQDKQIIDFSLKNTQYKLHNVLWRI